MASVPHELGHRSVLKRGYLCKLYDLQEGSTRFGGQPYTKSLPEQVNNLNTGQFVIQHQQLLLSLKEIITLLPWAVLER